MKNKYVFIFWGICLAVIFLVNLLGSKVLAQSMSSLYASDHSSSMTTSPPPDEGSIKWGIDATPWELGSTITGISNSLPYAPGGNTDYSSFSVIWTNSLALYPDNTNNPLPATNYVNDYSYYLNDYVPDYSSSSRMETTSWEHELTTGWWGAPSVEIGFPYNSSAFERHDYSSASAIWPTYNTPSYPDNYPGITNSYFNDYSYYNNQPDYSYNIFLSSLDKLDIPETEKIEYITNQVGGGLLVIDNQYCPTHGEEVTFTVSIKNASNKIETMGFDVEYNESILEYKGYSKGDLTLTFMVFDVDNSANILRVGGFDTEGIDMGDSGSIVKLIFEVKNCVSTKLILRNLKDDIKKHYSQYGQLNAAY